MFCFIRGCVEGLSLCGKVRPVLRVIEKADVNAIREKCLTWERSSTAHR
jgi:hypothetical protein